MVDLKYKSLTDFLLFKLSMFFSFDEKRFCIQKNQR